MSLVVLTAAHVSIGTLNFTDDEVLRIHPRPVRVRIEQKSQTGALSILQVGNDAYEFDITFHVFSRSTLEKLDQLRQLLDAFTIRPFLYEDTVTSYQVVWSDERAFREQWVRGRREALWDLEVIWKESLATECIAATDVGNPAVS